MCLLLNMGEFFFFKISYAAKINKKWKSQLKKSKHAVSAAFLQVLFLSTFC